MLDFIIGRHIWALLLLSYEKRVAKYVTNTISDSVLSKTAIFPETREGNMYSSNESARGSSLREANV